MAVRVIGCIVFPPFPDSAHGGSAGLHGGGGTDDRCLWHDLRAMMSIRYRGLINQATGK